LQNADGRIVFAIPYEQRFTLIGTTDVPYAGDPACAAISDAETQYLCETVSKYFRVPVTARDVRWAYAGVRPLVDDERVSASKVTRDYRLELDLRDAPLLSVFGGKLTTYRRLAEIALGRLAARFPNIGPEWTGHTPLPGGDLPNGDFKRFLHDVKQRWAFLSDPLAYRLARAYGTNIEHVLGAAPSSSALGEQFGGGLSEAEVEYLRRVEWAATAEDILWRRTKLGLHLSPDEQARLIEYMDRSGPVRR
jgi:glycerol-3-phosphate dehydrogenase